MKLNYCSPKKNINGDFTCFSFEELVEIANAFNNYINKYGNICKKIDGKFVCALKTPINIKNKNKEELYKSISKRLFKLCGKNDYKWIDLNFINSIPDNSLKESVKYFTFKPKMTKTNTTWLTSTNINELLQQYTNSDFVFLGAQPSDYSKITTIDYNKLKNTKYAKYIAIVFNLDTHKQPGSHWVAVFIDNKNKTIDYFDSLGNPINKNIQYFINEFNEFNLNINSIIHQKGGSQCGIYSVFYIIKRLSGMTFDEINKYFLKLNNNEPIDIFMKEYRKVLFRPRI